MATQETSTESVGSTAPLLVLAEFVFTEVGEQEYRRHLDRTLEEVRAVRGCLQAVVWKRPGRRYQFSTLWDDPAGVTRWVDNAFHQDVLMPGFRKWCTEGYFGEYKLDVDHKRARKCLACGRWTQSLPGYDEGQPPECHSCGAALDAPTQ